MTFAWYGHLKYPNAPIALAIVASWGIAFLEYCLQVPANRMGHGLFTAPQLKVLQEVITFAVFFFVSSLYLKERPSASDLLAFVLVGAAVAVSFIQPLKGWG